MRVWSLQRVEPDTARTRNTAVAVGKTQVDIHTAHKHPEDTDGWVGEEKGILGFNDRIVSIVARRWGI